MEYLPLRLASIKNPGASRFGNGFLYLPMVSGFSSATIVDNPCVVQIKPIEKTTAQPAKTSILTIIVLELYSDRIADILELICGRLNVQKYFDYLNIQAAPKSKKNLTFITFPGNEGSDFESQSFYVIKSR